MMLASINDLVLLFFLQLIYYFFVIDFVTASDLNIVVQAKFAYIPFNIRCQC